METLCEIGYTSGYNGPESMAILLDIMARDRSAAGPEACASGEELRCPTRKAQASCALRASGKACLRRRPHCAASATLCMVCKQGPELVVPQAQT